MQSFLAKYVGLEVLMLVFTRGAFSFFFVACGCAQVDRCLVCAAGSHGVVARDSIAFATANVCRV